jgi:hypothetical protein
MPLADLTTLEDFKAYARVVASTDDPMLRSMIAAYSAAARSYLNRDITSASYSITRDGRGTSMMVLPQYPVTAVSSVIVDGKPISAQTAFGLPGYRFTESAIILDGFRFTPGFGNVQVGFTAGYATVPADIAEAVNEWVALRYREIDRIGFASKSLAGETVAFITKAMPDGVKSALSQHVSIAPL